MYWTALAGAMIACGAFAADPGLDPKETIIGAWIVDLDAIAVQFENAPDEELASTISVVAGLFSSYVLEFPDLETCLKGGVEFPTPFFLEEDDEGVLWMIPKDAQDSLQFNKFEFGDHDHVVFSIATSDEMTVGIPLTRLFPRGMLARGDVDPDTDSAIQGWWEIDQELVRDMKWIQELQSERLRPILLGRLSGDNAAFQIGFFDGVMYSHSDLEDFTEPVGDYTIRASDGSTAAVSVLIDHGSNSDSEAPLLRIDFVGDDRIELIMTQLAPGPIPMVRADDVDLP